MLLARWARTRRTAGLGPLVRARLLHRAVVPRDAPRLVHRPEGGGGAALTVWWTGEQVLVREGDDDDDGKATALRAAALRDGCVCSACKDPSSGQKTFSTVEVPAGIGIAGVRATAGGLGVRFSDDVVGRPSHETVLPWGQVRRAAAAAAAGDDDGAAGDSLERRQQALLGRTGVQYWDAAGLAASVRTVDYEALMAAGEDDGRGGGGCSSALWDVVVDILRLGIVFVARVPRRESSVAAVASRVAGNLRETLYGRTFDVRAKTDPENVAYTAGPLALHQDLCYLAPPPMVQVLHCMDNACPGGESLFSDGHRAAMLLWPFVAAGPGPMAPLADFPVAYEYANRGHLYRASSPVLPRGPSAFSPAGIRWSPPFQAPPPRTADLAAWIPPARLLHRLLSDPPAVYARKMRPGECVLFDNLRVLHGRNAFRPHARDASARWLRGTYIAQEDFLSRAAHIPPGRAEMSRASAEPWSPAAAQRELRRGPWYADVLKGVREIDPTVQA